MTHQPSQQGDGDPGPSTAMRVIDEIAAAIDLDHYEVLPGCRLRNDFGASDRDLERLRRGLEHAFGFTIPTHAILGWQDVSNVITYVEQRLMPEAVR